LVLSRRRCTESPSSCDTSISFWCGGTVSSSNRGSEKRHATQDHIRGTTENIERRLQDSAARHQFGIIATHDLQDAMKKKGVELQMECRIYEVCNPLQAKKVLESDGAISTALPCWISVYGSPAHYTLATMRPTELMKAFGNPEIEPVAREVEEVLLEMMNEAAGNKG